MGRREMRAETTQVTAMVAGTDLLVISSVYCRGSLICTYLRSMCERKPS